MALGIFSPFRKPNPDVAAQELVDEIILTSLLYSKRIAHPDNKRSSDAGLEVAYLLLHLLDREIFARFGASKRDAIFDPIAQNAIATYAKAVLRLEIPTTSMLEAAEQMQDTLNSRQLVYGKCRSIFGEQFPGTGSMIFAFCFFVHRALGHTNRIDVDDILAGEKKISTVDMANFPDVETVVRAAAWIGSVLETLQLQKFAKCLG